jgi:hypothetical protein
MSEIKLIRAPGNYNTGSQRDYCSTNNSQWCLM